MKINLGIAEVTLKWKIGTEAKVVKVLREKSRIAAIKYYRDDLKKRKVGLMDSKNYIDSLAVKYGIEIRGVQ